MELYLQRLKFKVLYLAKGLNRSRLSCEQCKYLCKDYMSVELQIPCLARSRHESLPKEKKITTFISDTMNLF